MSASSRQRRPAPLRAPPAEDESVTRPDNRAADTNLTPSLQHALRLPGCPCCRVLRDAEPEYWRSLGEQHARGAAIAAVREAVGYCSRHLAQLQELRDPAMTADVARAAVEGALSALRAPRRRVRPDGGGDTASRPGERCPACAALALRELAAIDLLARLIVDDHQARKLLELGDGLCFDHLNEASTLPSPGAHRLREHAEIRLGDVRSELISYRSSLEGGSGRPSEREAAASVRAFRLLRHDPGRVG